MGEERVFVVMGEITIFCDFSSNASSNAWTSTFLVAVILSPSLRPHISPPFPHPS
jgi:hypothetical protein